MNQKRDRLIVANRMIQILFSEPWIIDALVILKTFKNGELYIHGINTSFLCACYLLHTKYCRNFSDEQINNIIVAAAIKDIGKIISSKECEDYLLYSIEYIKTNSQNKEIANILEKIYKESPDLYPEANIIYIISDFEKLLFNHSIDNDIKVSFNIKDSKLQKKDIKKFAKTIKIIKPVIKDIAESLESFCSSETEIDTELITTPIQLIIDSILENTWILDYLDYLQSNNKLILYSHSLNTALITATLLEYGNKNDLKMNGYNKAELIIAALLHDIGYMNNNNLDLTDHLSFNINEIQKAGRSFHISNGLSILDSILVKESVENRDNIIEAIQNHHEYLDGSGYYGLSSNQVSYPAHILSLANAIDLQLSHIIPSSCDINSILKDFQNEQSLNFISQKFDVTILYNTSLYLSKLLDEFIIFFKIK